MKKIKVCVLMGGKSPEYEISLPGLTSVSILPKEATTTRISYPELLDKIINLALEN